MTPVLNEGQSIHASDGEVPALLPIQTVVVAVACAGGRQVWD